MLPDKHAPQHARNVYNDVIHCEAPPPNLNFTNIFYVRFGAKPPNLMTANISSYTVLQLTGYCLISPTLISPTLILPTLISPTLILPTLISPTKHQFVSFRLLTIYNVIAEALNNCTKV